MIADLLWPFLHCHQPLQALSNLHRASNEDLQQQAKEWSTVSANKAYKAFKYPLCDFILFL